MMLDVFFMVTQASFYFCYFALCIAVLKSIDCSACLVLRLVMDNSTVNEPI